MKIKVSDYIVDFFNKNGIDTVFSITGGFAMHLNDSFGNNKNYDIYYQHHEQACGYSGVGYSKTNSKPVIVCTTAGCAATNTISPCLVAYQDSLPVLFISGQSKSMEVTRYLNNDNMKSIDKFDLLKKDKKNIDFHLEPEKTIEQQDYYFVEISYYILITSNLNFLKILLFLPFLIYSS